MNVLITFTNIGTDAGPFNLFSDASVPPFCCSFASGVTRQQLLNGYPAIAPNGTTTIRVRSTGVCLTTVDVTLPPTTTTTTTVANLFNWSSGNGSTTLVCSFNSYTQQRWSSSPVLALGVVIHSCPGLNCPMNGGDIWYKDQATLTLWKVNNLGIITASFVC